MVDEASMDLAMSPQGQADSTFLSTVMLLLSVFNCCSWSVFISLCFRFVFMVVFSGFLHMGA